MVKQATRNFNWVADEPWEDLKASRPWEELVEEQFLSQLLTVYNEVHLVDRMKKGELYRDEHKFVLVDLRPPEFYEEGHFATAISMPLETVEERYQELADADEVVVYSHQAFCKRGMKGGLKLAQLGVYVRVMNSGWKEWKENGQPIEVGSGS